MKVINAKIPMLLAGIEKIATKSLDGHEIVNVISIKKELIKHSEIIAETQERILTSYGLKSNDGVYSWNHHESANEISKKINKLLSQESELSTIPLVESDHFYDSVKGLSLTEIEELSIILILQQ